MNWLMSHISPPGLTSPDTGYWSEDITQNGLMIMLFLGIGI